ncbi:MAG: hypothetical protein IJ356_08590 [Erysipelotrichaceae bacterium]|nr:hypothetical protein [Erysipelotrichaceae bacterium]
MKTVTLSNRFYYRELNEKDASAIKNDILLYNQMLHKAYKYLTLKYQGILWDFDSLQKEMKRLYHTNDYFPLPVIWKAKHILKCRYEQYQKAIQQKQNQLKRIEAKISEK